MRAPSLAFFAAALAVVACASSPDDDALYRAAIAASAAAAELDDTAEARGWLARAVSPAAGFERRRLAALLDHKPAAEAALAAAPARLAASRDGERLAIAAADGAIAIHDARTLAPIARFPGEQAAYGAAFSPDGAHLVMTSRDGLVRLYDAASGDEAWSATGGGKGLANVAFSPAGDRIAYGSWIRDARGVIGLLAEFDAATGRELARWEFGDKPVVVVAYSPDGARLAAGTWGWRVGIWARDRAAAPRILDFDDAPAYSAIDDIAWSPDGALVAAATRNGAPRVWNTATGARVAELHGARSAVFSVTFSVDGRFLLAGAEDGTLRRWRVADWRAESSAFAHDSPIRAIAALPSGALATIGDDRALRLWPAPREAFAGTAEFHYATPASPDGAILAASAADGTISLFRIADGARIGALPGLDGALNDAAFSADGARLVGCNWGAVVRLWTIADAVFRDMQGFEGGSNGCALSPDGRIVAAGSTKNAAFLFDSATGALLRKVALPAAASRVRFSPDGSALAVGDGDGGLHLIDPATGTARAVAGHAGAVNALLYSDDGRYLISAGEDRRIVIREAGAGAPLRELTGHRQRVWGLAFIGDDRLVSASADRTLRFWRISDGAMMGVVRGFSDGPYSLAYDPGSDRLIVNVPGAPLAVIEGRAP